jgi:WD40 repeat protein
MIRPSSRASSTAGRIASLLAVSLVAFAALPEMQGAEKTPGEIPGPHKILKDSHITQPKSTITLDPSGRSGTFSVSGGNADNMVLDVAFSPDGRWLLAGRFQGQLDVWDTSSWSKTLTTQADKYRVTSLATSPDSKTVAVGGDEKVVRILNITSGAVVTTGPKCHDYADEMVFSPDGRLLVVLVNGGPDFVYDVVKHKILKKIPANGAAFSGQGDTLVTSLAEKLTLWNTGTWEATRELADPRGHNSKIALDPGGHRVFAGAWEGPTKIWDLSTGTAVLTLDAGFIASLIVSADGRRMFTAGDGYIRLWATDTGELLCTSSKLGLWDLDISRDGRWMAAGVDNTVQVWSVEDVFRTCE